MMQKAYKKISVYLICFLYILNYSCTRENIFGSGNIKTERRSVSNFESITVEGDLDVWITQDNNRSVKVEAEDNVLKFIETYTSGNTLKIRVRPDIHVKSWITPKVYISNDIYSQLNLAGSGNLYSEDTLQVNALHCELWGSGHIKLAASAEELTSNVQGSGHIDLVGNASDYRSEINGSGSIKALDLSCRNAKIRLNGSGEQVVKVRDYIDIKILGSGIVRYKGNPQKVDTEVLGSGTIVKL
ncbi:hypothetical protein COR50_02610 [Chitinophaga caeni]|uniref:Putative auto-transporter adhesin head GIN domain-containing protein n=1 Tax=Chitinophaga caeni TaxID=2029983 RepID=A0A291QQE9_9BACT|nr:head GIN domain-containing protein [Chitinophaga caeni]ATL46145.1 hypothetical protein COR50_02610 [Chitinophaga caeni]